MVYLSLAPHSHAVTLPPAASLQKVQKTTTPSTCTGATHRKAVGSSRYHNIRHSYRSSVPRKQTTNRTIHLSDPQGILRQSTPFMAS